MPARLPGDRDAVVKVQLDADEESVHEIDALLHWDGRRAARLIASDTVALVRDGRERMRGWTIARHLGWGPEAHRVGVEDVDAVRLASQA